jgi:hypothetical protein
MTFGFFTLWCRKLEPTEPLQEEGKQPDRPWRGQSVGADAVKRVCVAASLGGMDRAAVVEEMCGK